MKILHVTSEYFGLAKTGGLADVCQALPAALADIGIDVGVCMPAYRGTEQQLRAPRTVAGFKVRGQDFEVLAGRLADSDHDIYLFRSAALFDRDGDPYRDSNGVEYPDNGWRFGSFCEAVCQYIESLAPAPAVVHLHDWQTGLIAGLLRERQSPARTLFTIHNLAYQGIFGAELFDALGLPRTWWSADAVEQFGSFSFMKAGINFGDAVATVSPSYAREICTPEHGFGLDRYLRARNDSLHGILNGINASVWNPGTDPYIDFRYDISTVRAAKAANAAALRRELGLPDEGLPLIAFIGRFAHQKGVDILCEARDALASLPFQLVLLGSGEADLERQCLAWAAATPSRVRALIGVDEAMAHRLTAAADFQIMPSRYEPCGLSQMYAQHYGTVPLVRRTGGLIDTVVDFPPDAVSAGHATGIQFQHADVGGVLYGVGRATTLWNTSSMAALQFNGMRKDFSWRSSAYQYLDIYRSLHIAASRQRPQRHFPSNPQI